MKIFPQFTLRELLFAVLFVALGLASLRAGGALASIMMLLAIVLTMGLAIIAFVGRGELRAFAIGFSIPVLIYAVTVVVIGPNEFHPYRAQLPTSRILAPIFGAVVDQKWIDTQTGEVVPDYDPSVGDPFAGRDVRFSEQPDRQTFMTVGHVLIGMFFGYAGGKFAVLIYRRRENT
jgi:hypothetical protein